MAEERFGKLPTLLMCDPIAGSSLAAIKTYAALAFKQQRENSYSPPISDLVIESGLTRKSVLQGIDILELTGWISVKRPGRGRRNEYMIYKEPVKKLEAPERHKNGKPVIVVPPREPVKQSTVGDQCCENYSSLREPVSSTPMGTSDLQSSTPQGTRSSTPTVDHIKSTRERTKTRDIQENQPPAHAPEQAPDLQPQNPAPGYAHDPLSIEPPPRSEYFGPAELAEILAAAKRYSDLSGFTSISGPGSQALALDNLAREYDGLTSAEVIDVLEACDAGNRGIWDQPAWWAKNGSVWGPEPHELARVSWKSQTSRFAHVRDYLAGSKRKRNGNELSAEAQEALARIDRIAPRRTIEDEMRDLGKISRMVDK